ncbi:MAG: sugar transferase [Candidatus Anammoxibacter sp.]
MDNVSTISILDRQPTLFGPLYDDISKDSSYNLSAYYIYKKAIKAGYNFIRPALDLVTSAAFLLAAMPLILVSGLIIKLTSRGPMFYTQERVGKDGRVFRIIKLRSMRVDSESQTGPVWAKENDSRVTTFGKFLRKTHMDELPQLINVIKGDMSLIGPRPERPVFAERLKVEVPGYANRLVVKPGLTGLAQCYYKYDEGVRDVCRKLRYDMIYIKKKCLLLDVKILALTFVVSFVRANGQG